MGLRNGFYKCLPGFFVFEFEQLMGKDSISGNLIQNHFFFPFRKLVYACMYMGDKVERNGPVNLFFSFYLFILNLHLSGM